MIETDKSAHCDEQQTAATSDTSAAQSINQSRALAMVRTRTLLGVEARSVVVEVHLANGLPAFSTVGLPEVAVRESKDRVRGAILNSGFEFPAKRITVNLSPADLPKSGSRFDLPIALGILAASGQIPSDKLVEYEFVGELALDGALRPVYGVLPTSLACAQAKHALVVSTENADEAALADHCEVLPASNLLAVCAALSGQGELLVAHTPKIQSADSRYADIADVRGQQMAKRALEIAATGGHSVLMMGPPGTGKSMMASRLPGILPPLSTQQALESAGVRSITQGKFEFSEWRQRPFRSPHHSASPAALVGGGSTPKPGEISLAHHGVLFLDELTEFSRATLEQLREPLETGYINIARATQSVSFPAEFMLVAACNPCKCGYLGDGTDRCQCSATSIESYRSKLSGPLLDRIDMHVQLSRVSAHDLQSSENTAETSKAVQGRVSECQNRQRQRQTVLNSELQGSMLDQHCALDSPSQSFLAHACERLKLSARAYHRILRLARTIADMQNEPQIQQNHLSEAIGFRKFDRGR